MKILPLIVLAGASVLPMKAGAEAANSENSVTNLATPMPRGSVNSDSTASRTSDTTPTPSTQPSTTTSTTSPPTTTTPTTTKPSQEATQGHKATSIDCVKDANVARGKIGFPAFEGPKTDEQRLPIDGIEPSVSGRGAQQTAAPESGKAKIPLASVCKAIRDKTKDGNSTADQAKGIFMYSPQTTAAEDCATAIQYWTDGMNNFSALPPPYSDKETPYTENQNISFVGLYNPRQDPTLDCAFITCHPENATKNSLETGIGHSSCDRAAESQPSVPVEDSDESENPIYSIICLSTPQALQNNEPPFTQEEWNSITGVGNSSRRFTVFAAATLTVAALAHSLFWTC